MENTNYGTWTLKQVKDVLRTKKLRLSGRKQELIARLVKHDAITGKDEPEVEYHMVLPQKEAYKDLHVGMVDTLPKTSSEKVDTYMTIHDAKWAEKVPSLYKERFLRYVRGVAGDDSFLVTAAVWAEMAKNICYKVDIKIDQHGVVEEAQCECGAGQGPAAHCKHVGLVLHGYSSLVIKGTIVTELTCTQVLQTFHHTKAYKASPVKADTLQVIRGKKSLVYDPRPAAADPGLKSRVHNLCVNFQASNPSSKPMPVLQTIPPANPHALAHDHDYMRLTPQDEFLLQENILQITAQDAARIEAATRKQRNSRVWREERLKRITASNFGEICKATERKNKHKLATRLITPSSACGAAIEHGIKYEQTATDWFETEFDVETSDAGLFISSESPFLGATPDRVIDCDQLLEVKCPYTARQMDISPATVPYLEIVNGELSLKKDHQYYYQVQGQLFCADRKMCYFLVFTFKDKKVMKICRDDVFVAQMKVKLKEFFVNHFKPAYLEFVFLQKIQPIPVLLLNVLNVAEHEHICLY